MLLWQSDRAERGASRSERRSKRGATTTRADLSLNHSLTFSLRSQKLLAEVPSCVARIVAALVRRARGGTRNDIEGENDETRSGSR